MKKSRLFIILASCILGLLVVCWPRAQTPSHPLKVMVNGVEIHTLFGDQQNALVGHLEAAGQTNAIELFRQYRCSHGFAQSSSELGHTTAVLQYLREGRTNQAIQRLEQHLSAYANMMLNTYGCLNPTNRAQVRLESLEQARDYFTKFPPPRWGPEMEKAVNKVLRISSEAARAKNPSSDDLLAAKEKLAELRKVFTDKHPDVQDQIKRVETLEKQQQKPK